MTYSSNRGLSALAASRIALILAFSCATAVLAVWLWSKFCEFPALAWNDLRLAPTIALARGLPVYPTAEAGTINTWTYGPLPLLFFLPAAWGSTPASALLIGGALNLALTLGALACVCFSWPVDAAESQSRTPRALALALCVALWPEIYFAQHSSDNLAIACGLIGNLVLVRAKSSRARWLAAALATAALGCKQTSASIPLAQVLWLGATAGGGMAGRHVLRCVVCGVVLAAASIAWFGAAGLRFVLIELPAHFHWAPQPLERLYSAAPELLLQVGLPLIVMVALRRSFARASLLLPALAWLCALPLGFAALLKFGGRMNSVYSFMLWLPPVATWWLTTRAASEATRAALLAGAVAAFAIGCVRIAEAPRFFLRPQTAAYDDAALGAERWRGQVWFPLHPLVTLYSDGVYYHDEDGLFVRRMTHKAVTAQHVSAHLPPAFRATAFLDGWSDFRIARSFLPENVQTVAIGAWSLKVATPEASR